MHTSSTESRRAAQARINGAKSRGPKTPQGLERARAASLKHGLYAARPKLLPSVDARAYEELRANYLQIWQPANQYLADKLEDLVACRWELNRLRAVRRCHLAELFDKATLTNSAGGSIVCETEIQASAPGSALDRFDYRIRRCALEISRLERDMLRLHHHFSQSGPSHNSLITQEPELRTLPEGPAVEWAAANLDFDLDPHQAEILAAAQPLTLLSAARYAGKTTALALRALYESVHNPTARIVCLSPNDALQNQLRDLAASLGHTAANVHFAPVDDATLVLVDDAADLPDLPAPGAAQLILAATPNGARGAFHALWHDDRASRILAPDFRCDRLAPDILALARASLSEAAYLQEFRCEFLPEPQPRCRLLPLAQ